MESKYSLKQLCKNCAIPKCPFRNNNDNFCDDYKTIKEDLDKLEKYKNLEKLLKQGYFFFKSKKGVIVKVYDPVIKAEYKYIFSEKDNKAHEVATNFCISNEYNSIRNLYLENYGKKTVGGWSLTGEELIGVKYNNALRKDLGQNEKYQKAIELIEKKKVSVPYILYISKKYIKEMQLSVYHEHYQDNLTQEEFDLIVEVFNNGK